MQTLTKARRSCFSALALLLLVTMASAERSIDVSGYYVLRESVASEFPEVRWLELSEMTSAAPFQRVPLFGAIRLRERGPDGIYVSLPLSQVSLQESALRFETAERLGSSLRFAGAFEKIGVVRDIAAPGEVILRGTLDRLRNGKVEKSVDVAFTFTEGD
jgi:hypothetical protein